MSRPHLRLELSAADSAAAMVVISDPDAVEVPDKDVRRMLFQLTSAEARLAQRLAHGISLADAAGQLGLSLGTVRKRLKSIFEKTGTSRQAELMTFLVNAGRLHGPSPGK